MRNLIVAAGLAAFCCVSVPASEADAQSRSPRAGAQSTKKFTRADPARQGRRTADRGPCVVDNGKPESRLDFRNRCDVEEFWSRVNAYGSGGDNL